MPAPVAHPLPLFAHAEHWFDRARASLLDALPCRQGCSRCCIGPFPVTMLDVAELQRGLAVLDPAQRADVESRARDQVQRIESAFPRLASSQFLDAWDDGALDAVVETFADLSCPALDQSGSCRVYAFRPVTCRTMGIPRAVGGMIEGACAVQTAVPILRPSAALMEQEDRLAAEEAEELERLRRLGPLAGDEVLLPYGFLPERISARL